MFRSSLLIIYLLGKLLEIMVRIQYVKSYLDEYEYRFHVNKISATYLKEF